ncbi:hypothetical protein AB1Y20_009805 [Prymnesium parvum]|uniref:Uncharacterized protein n=1 Tax=Prymnesium parvum TaxID=97485 RepID=A0AB34K6Z6_PRYPA
MFDSTRHAPDGVAVLKTMKKDLREVEGNMRLKKEKDDVVAGVGQTLKKLFHKNDERDFFDIKNSERNIICRYTLADSIIKGTLAIESDNYKGVIKDLIEQQNSISGICEHNLVRIRQIIYRKELIIEAAIEIGIELDLRPYILCGERVDEYTVFFKEAIDKSISKLIGAVYVLLGKDVPP